MFALGPYLIRIALRKDNPAFARYLVFRGDRLVGAQFSRPSITDCQWLEHAVYAEARTVEHERTNAYGQERAPGRRPGRPRKYA